MECSVWYASPYRVLLVIPAAKTPTSRHELRHAPTGLEFAKLSAVECVATAKRNPGDARPPTSIFELCSYKPILCHSYYVARGGC